EELQPWMHQLEPHADRQHAADQSAEQCEHEIHRADVFVVGRIEVTPPTMRMIGEVLAVSFRHRSHDSSPSSCRPRTIRACAQHHRGVDCAAATVVAGGTSSRAYFFFASSTQAENACSLTARTAIGIKAWSLPHSSEH